MLKKVFFITFFYSLCSFGFQQNKNQKLIDYLNNLYNKGAYQKVLDSINTQTFNVAKNSKDSLLQTKIHYLKANSLYGLGKYKESIFSYNNVIKFSTNNDEGKNLKGMAFFDRAFSEYYTEQYLISYNSVKSAEAILSKLKNPNYDYLISIYADVSSSATGYGYFNEAEYYIKKGLDTYEKHKKHIQVDKNQASKDVLLLYKSVVLYAAQGNEKKLISSLTKLQKIRNQKQFNTKEILMYAVSLNLVGDFYLNHREKFNLKEALFKAGNYLEKALFVLDKKNNPEYVIQFKFNLVKKLRFGKNYKEALLKNNEILSLASKDDSRIPFFLAQRGIVYLGQKDLNKALETFSKMILSIHKGNQKLDKDFTNFKPSSALNHTGLFVEIADMILEAFPKKEQAKEFASKMYLMGLTQFKNVYSKEEFSEKLKDYYNLTFRGLLKTKEVHSLKTNEIITEIENIENKLAWKNFLQNRTLSKSFLPDSLFNFEQKIRSQIVDARKKNDTLLIIDLEKKILEYRSKIEKKHPEIATSLFSKFSISEFQSTLKKEDVVLRYKFFKEDLYVFKITNLEVILKKITFKKDAKTTVKEYLKIIKSIQENKEIGAYLYTALVPFKLNFAQNLYIIPDQILHNLPFETLVNTDKSYLIESYNISYASHLVFLNQEKKGAQNSMLKIFLPNYKSSLKGANEEAEKIATLFPSKLYSAKQASKNNFIKNSKNASILHLAMHAKIDNVKPELSYFMFSDSKEDKLYLEELYGLKLNSNLAVLSACNTGSGAIDNNLSPVSLQRAFSFSGIPATVSSLWKIPDNSTKEIMIHFYTNLAKGFTKNEALKEAKKAYLKKETNFKLKKPYYWAGLIVSGDVAPVVVDDNKQIYWVILLCFSVLVLLFFKFFKKK